MRRFCPTCGAKQPDPDGRFCPECGAKIASEPVAADPAGHPSRTETRSRRWPLLAVGGGLAAAVGVAAALLLFGGGSEAIERPAPRDLPANVAAIVLHAPEDVETVTRAELGHALLLAAKQAGLDKAPEPGHGQYEELRESALKTILDGVWIQGQAAEMGIATNDEEIAKELRKIRKENFPKRAGFRKFIKETGFTREDIDDRVRLQILSTKIQNRLSADPSEPSQSDIENYYQEHKDTQFSAPATDTEPAKSQPLSKVRSQIRDMLTQEIQQEKFSDFVAKFNRKWRWRTVCAPVLAVDRCSNGRQPTSEEPDVLP